jgi:hypothetical protein
MADDEYSEGTMPSVTVTGSLVLVMMMMMMVTKIVMMTSKRCLRYMGSADNRFRDTTATITASATLATISTTAAVNTSAIGGGLYAGQHGGHHHNSSRASTTDWYTASATASVTYSITDAVNATASATDAWNATASLTTSYTDDYNLTASATSASFSKGHNQSSSTTTSASASATSTQFNSSTGTNTFSAPHYVVYADEWLSRMPSVADLEMYNRFILAFWMSDSGAVDDARAWEQWDADYRAGIIEEYHAAGIALMVSAFGSTDTPTSSGMDPAETAQELAAWVIQYGLDGVDVDYEGKLVRPFPS